MTALRYFVTGTDTGVGKTIMASALLQAGNRRGWQTLGLKPVAAGWAEHESVNPDVRSLQSAASIHLDTQVINPACIEPPIAPHIGARDAGLELNAEQLAQHCLDVCAQYAPELAVVEGAGGWLVPLNERQTMADLCHRLDFPVIVVVGMRLGCLNHALLTIAAVREAGLELAGWIANRIDPDMSVFDENLETLIDRIEAPLIGSVPALTSSAMVEQAADALFLERLNGVGA